MRQIATHVKAQAAVVIILKSDVALLMEPTASHTLVRVTVIVVLIFSELGLKYVMAVGILQVAYPVLSE